MKYNYPIKYSIMPICAYVGENLSNNHTLNIYNSIVRYGYKHLEVIGYVVSKCYILSEINSFLSDGTTNTSYRVVFPYQKVNDKGREAYRKVEPTRYNAQIGEIYDTVEEAVLAKNELNQIILSEELSRIPRNKNYQKNIEFIQEAFSERIEKLNKLEVEIEANTKEMIVSENQGQDLSIFQKKLKKQ